MQIIIILLPLAAFCCWIYAERYRGFAARLATGIACILLTGGICLAIANITPHYESASHRSSLRLAGDLISKGDTQKVHQAIQAYNRIASSSTTYRASMEMWRVLNHGPRQ